MIESYGIIYKATNTQTGKVYIGQTKVSLAERKGDHRRKALIHGSGSYFHSAIKKYGFDVFLWETIDRAYSFDEINEKEKHWIAFYHSDEKKYGYNITKGGRSFEATEEFRRKISATGRGRKLPAHEVERRRVAYRGAGNNFWGKKHTEEAKQKNRLAHVGKKLTPEHKAKVLKRGEDNGRAILKLSQVIEIKRAILEGAKTNDLAKKYGVTKNSIKSIRYNRSWAWVQI